MIKEDKFNDSKIVDFFNDLSAEEKEEAELKAEIAMAIHNKRVALNMLQKDFAEKNHVSQSMVSKWESGDYNFTVSNLRKVLSALGMEMVLQDKKNAGSIQPIQANSKTEWKATSSGAGSSGYRLAASPGTI